MRNCHTMNGYRAGTFHVTTFAKERITRRHEGSAFFGNACRLRHHRLCVDLNFRGRRPSGWQNFLLRSHRRRALGRSSPRGLPWHQEQPIQLQLSTAASLRVIRLCNITVDVLPIADSEDKLGGLLHYDKHGLHCCCRIVYESGRRRGCVSQFCVGVMY